MPLATSLTSRSGDRWLYVSSPRGQVVALLAGARAQVLDLTGRVSGLREQGLLGLAFSRDGRELYVLSQARGVLRIDPA